MTRIKNFSLVPPTQKFSRAPQTLRSATVWAAPFAAGFSGCGRPNMLRCRRAGRPWPKISIDQHQHGGLLRVLHHILKLALVGVWLFELGGNFGDRFEEAQEITALDRVIHVLRERAARALNLADTTPTTLPRSSTNAPPELPGCTGTLIWKYRASSCAPERDATSPLACLGANPCKPMLGKPTVTTVLPKRTARLEAIGNGANLPSAFSRAKSLAESTFTTLAGMRPAAVIISSCVPLGDQCSLL